MVSKVGFTVYTFILLIVDTHNKENPAKPTESASDVSDSGVSVTTSSSVYDEINHEQQKLVNKIDVKHTSDQTEKKIDIKCVSDQRDDKTSKPCQQTTVVEINKQDQIVKVLCHSIVNENISKYSPQKEISKYSSQRETSKYSSQKEAEKQVAKITPFKSEDGKFFVTFHISTKCFKEKIGFQNNLF